MADDTIQSQAGSALSRKASLHFKTRCSHDQGDDLATRDGVFADWANSTLLYSLLGSGQASRWGEVGFENGCSDVQMFSILAESR